MSNVAEGFERLHVSEKLQFYNVARGSSAEVRSLLYVVEDTYPSLVARSAALGHDCHTRRQTAHWPNPVYPAKTTVSKELMTQPHLPTLISHLL